MNTIHVDIVSAEGQIFSGESVGVFAPATLGEVGILPLHAPMLTGLGSGEVRVQMEDGEDQYFFVSGGMMELQPHLVTVLADTAVRAHDIDEAAAVEAKRLAEEAIQNSGAAIDLARAQSELIEAAARLQTLDRLRKRKL